MNLLNSAWHSVRCPVVGMIHLEPLVGSPRYAGDWQFVRQRAIDDATALIDGGVHGLMLENFGDTPFLRGSVPQATIAQMSIVAYELRQMFPEIPLGINVLRNDGVGALGIAQAAAAQFIRVNVLCGARLTDQGLIQGIAAEVMRRRQENDAENIRVFADVDVKHSVPLAPTTLDDEVADILERGHADAIIVSGTATGKPTPITSIQAAKRAAEGAPVWVGSGVCADSVEALSLEADGLIVGSSLKIHGISSNPVDPERVQQLMQRMSPKT